MNFAQFIELADQEKLIIAEIQPARQLEQQAWEFPPTGYSYLYSLPFTDGEIVKVTIDENELIEVFSLASCESTASSFYYDPWNQYLYVHTPNGDSPETTISGGEYKYCIMAYFWIGFCNEQRKDNQVNFEKRENVLEDGGLELWSSVTNLKKWTESISGTSTINRDSTETYDTQSAYSVRLDIDCANSDAYIYNAADIKLRPGGKAKIRFKYKTGLALPSITFKNIGSNVYLDSNGNWQAVPTNIILPISQEWAEYELEFVVHDDYSLYKLYLGRNNAGGQSIWYDYVEVLRYYLVMNYLPQLSEESIPSITQAVGDYYMADEKIQFGTLWFTDSAWWYSKRGIYNFHNKNCIIRIGAVGSDYEDLEIIFTGVTKKPRINDERVELDTKDPREKEFQMIPRDRFDLTTYPNLDPRYENMVIPILFGEKTNITPICIDTVNHVYKITQTVFGGTTYAQQAIDDVYKDGIALATPADYSVDLNNGQFTLTADPGKALISCDAHGIKCDFEDGTYSENVADIWHFILTILNEIPETRLNLASFLNLKAGRTQKIGKYLAVETETIEFGKALKRSAIFQSFPLLNGQYEVRRYVAGTDDDTPVFRNEDYHAFQLEEDTDLAIRTIVIKYDQDPTNGEEWKYVADDYENTEWKHGEKGTLIIETALIDPVEANSIRQFYTRLLRDPADKLIATINPRLLNLNPTDKGIFNKTVVGDEGNEITILEDEVYRLLEATKNISDGTVEATFIKDMQSVGYYFHADVAHIDIAYEDIAHIDGGHVDTPHVDTPHSDVPYQDDHTDEPYQDTAHGDVPLHDDYLDHNDAGHVDKHGDIPHTDIPHVDEPYEDHDDETPHSDVPHGNTPYQDAAHADEPHVDEPHVDVPHSDSYI